jgi:uncharacterized protein YuzE
MRSARNAIARATPVSASPAASRPLVMAMLRVNRVRSRRTSELKLAALETYSVCVVVEISDRGSAYIRYQASVTVHSSIEVGGEGSEVVAAVDVAGHVIGIEIVDVSIEENVARARAHAAELALPFPRDIVAAARNVSAA